ncbi:NAD(P)-dependent oxidoreductase [Candidatus Calescamantes bacterium]|nr:NAD(P)-dependent oxidoreductase [Candidatus Calescamantes bacterium]
MKVLITGGSGNIGFYVVNRLRRKYEIAILDVKPSLYSPDVPFLKVNLLNSEKVKEVVKGFDTVVHLAAIPNPFNDPDERVLSVNVISTYNLMEAVKENGIRRVVYGCSESASGFGIHNVRYRPAYIPIDEEHPSWPHESYSLSKYFGEIICKEYSRAYGIECISLRYPWVWLDTCRDAIEKILSQKDKEIDEKDWFGTYIFPEDVAQGIELSLDFEIKDRDFPFEVFYLTAEDNFYDMDSLELISKLFPNNPPYIKKSEYFSRNSRASLFDISKAKEKLGYNPEFTWRDFDSPKRIRPGG